MSNVIEKQMEEISVSIEEANKVINQSKSLKKLLKNKDFIGIISEGYCKNEALRLVMLKADPNLCMDKDIMADVNNQLTSISYLNRYFRQIMQLGIQAEKALVESNKEQDELLQEMQQIA